MSTHAYHYDADQHPQYYGYYADTPKNGNNNMWAYMASPGAVLSLLLGIGYALVVYTGVPFHAVPAYVFRHAATLPVRVASRFLQRQRGSNAAALFGLAPGDILKEGGQATPLKSFGSMMLRGGGAKDAPPGLGNVDNSCYQNSVLQGLASLPSFSGFLKNTTHLLPGLSRGTTNSVLGETMGSLNDPSNHGRVFWTPAKLKSMSSWQQQDAQEYYSKILDEIDKEILKASHKTAVASGLETITKLFNTVEAESASSGTTVRDGEDTQAKSTSPKSVIAHLRNPVEGLLGQRVGCTSCGYSEGISLIPFNCLTVPLGNEWLYDIRDCLDAYTALEPIEGVECARCTLLRTESALKHLLQSPTVAEDLRTSVSTRLHAVQEALRDEDFSDNTLIKRCQVPKKNWMKSTKTRQGVIARAPQSLVIHVNRSVIDPFSGMQRKNTADVLFPKTLDLGAWCLGEDADAGDEAMLERWRMEPTRSMLADSVVEIASRQQYELRAVVTHKGYHENGHYICFRKHPYSPGPNSGEDFTSGRERWWRLSDEFVSEVNENEVEKQGGVFMLFYEKIAHPLLLPPLGLPTPSTTPSPVLTGTAILEEQERVVSSHTGPPSPADVPLPETPPMQAKTPESDPTILTPLTPLTPLPSVAAEESDNPADVSASETASTSATTDDESEGGQHVHTVHTVPIPVASPLLMRTAGAERDESMTKSLRMVAAT